MPAAKRTPPSRPPRGALVLVGLAVLAVAVVFFISRPASAHPQPRPDVAADHVMEHSHFAGYPRVQETYRMAAAIPHVLDGLYCHCDCANHSGHYSLLDCFRDQHGAGCDICLTEAQLAYRMTQEGRSLDEIRAEVDRLYAHAH
jgi:hypothetical protein